MDKIRRTSWKKKRYSIEELGGLDYLLDCIQKGKTQSDVAKELGISHSSDVIWRYLKSKGYTWTQLKKKKWILTN